MLIGILDHAGRSGGERRILTRSPRAFFDAAANGGKH
jgi:hypothetical protein